MEDLNFLIEKNIQPTADELINLFAQTSWAHNRSKYKIEKALKKADLVICIRESGKLVGYGRIITDACFRGLLDDVIVDEGCRGKGYGALIVKSLLDLAADVDEIFLNANDSLSEYYERYGFEKFNGLTMVKKN
jgi:N-acetylglutamate synthase-like GNAT family acetyltransferase